MKLSIQQKEEAADFFKKTQECLLFALSYVDGKATPQKREWNREGGGGMMATIRGEVVEKAGANFSRVTGDKYPALEGEHQNKPYFATGVSTITHMMNPFAPIGHMNVRLLEVGDKFWFGGGADLTPFQAFEEDTQDFHDSFKKACDLYESDAYTKFSQWCDEYFYIKHRQSVRGVGGVFFDYLAGEFEKTFSFIKSIATAYVEVFPKILERRKNMLYSEEDKDAQLYWRGRYVEFNLVYDRGTKFGLMTGGDIEAIMVSLPPVVKW